MAEADELRQWALTTGSPHSAAASTDQLGRHLEFMAAALPSRANDAETGRRRFAVYTSILGGYSDRALAFMARRACETLEWFPSPKQCLDLLAGYRPPQSAQAAALIECDTFMHRFFNRWIRNLRDGSPIGDVPERWKRIAVEEGSMRRLQGGAYVSRALYHGPPSRPYERPLRTALVPSDRPPGGTSKQLAVAGLSEGLVP